MRRRGRYEIGKLQMITDTYDHRDFSISSHITFLNQLFNDKNQVIASKVILYKGLRRK